MAMLGEATTGKATTETERLRALLDEHGIGWEGKPGRCTYVFFDKCAITFHAPQGTLLAGEANFAEPYRATLTLHSLMTGEEAFDFVTSLMHGIGAAPGPKGQAGGGDGPSDRTVDDMPSRR